MRVAILAAEGVEPPRYATPGSAGVDLCARESFGLAPGERRLVPTGIRLAIPLGYEGQIRARSGLALRHGIAMVNAPGTIDSDYRGEVGVLLINLGDEEVSFAAGERVGQLVFAAVERVEWESVSSLEASERGEGGFGSTGR